MGCEFSFQCVFRFKLEFNPVPGLPEQLTAFFGPAVDDQQAPSLYCQHLNFMPSKWYSNSSLACLMVMMDSDKRHKIAGRDNHKGSGRAWRNGSICCWRIIGSCSWHEQQEIMKKCDHEWRLYCKCLSNIGMYFINTFWVASTFRKALAVNNKLISMWVSHWRGGKSHFCQLIQGDGNSCKITSF